jgi:hypothetical protein
MKTLAFARFISLRNLIAILAAMVAIGTGSRAQAQTPSLDSYYDRLDPKDTFKFKWKGDEKVCDIGALHWMVPPSEFTTGGLDRNYTSYCAQVLVPSVAGKKYRFRMQHMLEPSNYGLEATPEGIRAAEKRVTLIRELFGRYYTDNKTADPVNTLAFQAALWELTQETEPKDRAVSFDMFAGDFQANYPKDQAPDYVLRAQKMLDSLTGNDAIYFENPQLSGRELIRLQGIPSGGGKGGDGKGPGGNAGVGNVDDGNGNGLDGLDGNGLEGNALDGEGGGDNGGGDVAQSQYALRYINGGVTGTSGFVSNLPSGGGIGGGFGGGGGGGAGSGGGDAAGGAPLLTTGTPSTTTTTTDSPPPSSGGRVPAGGPSTSAPAPAGLILGLVAVGVLASRRVYTRFTHK